MELKDKSVAKTRKLIKDRFHLDEDASDIIGPLVDDDEIENAMILGRNSINGKRRDSIDSTYESLMMMSSGRMGHSNENMMMSSGMMMRHSNNSDMGDIVKPERRRRTTVGFDCGGEDNKEDVDVEIQNLVMTRFQIKQEKKNNMVVKDDAIENIYDLR